MAKSTTPELDPDRQTTLDEMIGHGMVRGYLRRGVAAGQIPQSMLLSGPAGVGKKTLAWSLAKEIAAAGGDVKTHRGAAKISRGTHPDVKLLTQAGGSAQILVDPIRELGDWASTYPSETEKKIALIAPADRMNAPAANSLLKLLEEPPTHLILILVTSDPAVLLPTIRSRCTPIPLEAVEFDELVPWLVRRAGGELDETRARLAAELAEGRPGVALALAGKDGLETRGRLLGELGTLREHGFAAVFGVADRLLSIRPDLNETLRTVMLLLRDALSVALGTAELLNRDMADEIRGFAAGLSPEGILEAATSIEAAIGAAPEPYHAVARLQFIEALVIAIGRELRRT